MSCKKNCKRAGYSLRKIDRETVAYIIRNKFSNGISTNIYDLRQKFKLTKRQTYYLVHKLIDAGFIKNIDSGIILLEPTQKGEAHIKSLLGDLQSYDQYVTAFFDRAHRITVNQPIITWPENNRLPEGFCVSEKSSKLHWKKPQLILKDKNGGVTVRICSKTVSYHFKECYGRDPHHIIHLCLERCFELSESLRSQGFNLNLPKIAVIEQHHALFNKALAKFTHRYNIFYKSDRLSFDSSIASNEFELINSEHSSEDVLKLIELFEAVIRDEISLHDLKKICALYPKIKRFLYYQRLIGSKNGSLTLPECS